MFNVVCVKVTNGSTTRKVVDKAAKQATAQKRADKLNERALGFDNLTSVYSYIVEPA